jgi:chromosomal replication initiator protein
VAVSVPLKHRSTSPAEQILARIASEIGESLFALWFSGDDCIRSEGNAVHVLADSDFELRRIQKGYSSLIRRISTDILGAPVHVEFAVRECTREAVVEAVPRPRLSVERVERTVDPVSLIFQPKKAVSPEEPRDQSTVERAYVRPRHQLKEFAFGTENEFVRAAVKQVLQCPGQYSPFFIFGESGSGKTHLLEGLTSELRAMNRNGSCIYVTAEQFTSSFVHSLRGGGLPNFRRKYRDVEVLAIDDVHFFANKRATIHELQYTIDHLVRAGKQLIFSSDRAPIELSELGNEVLNRLNSGLVCPLHFAGESSRLEIVNRLCRERSLNWPADVNSLIAAKVTRDGRKISGAVNQICAAAAVRNLPVNRDFVQELLGSGTRTSGRLTTINQIEKVVSDFFGVSPNDLRSGARMQKIGNARMVAMYFCRRHTAAALSEIGEYFGGRSHSTVIAAIRRIEAMAEENAEILISAGRFPIKEVIDSLANRLRLA